MNTIQISEDLTKQVKYFQEVYPIDLLPSTIIKPSMIFTSLDKHYMPGSHWVTVCFSNSTYAEYFDSYGLPNIQTKIMAYLHCHSISWTFKGHRLQGSTSNVCGHYCCIYAQHKAKGLSMTSVVNMFSPARYTCNDIRAVRMFRTQFGECLAFSLLEEQQNSCKS
jgi:hypothetical protein